MSRARSESDILADARNEEISNLVPRVLSYPSLLSERERGTVRREPWKRGWGRSKKAPVASPFFWLLHVHCMNVALQLVN